MLDEQANKLAVCNSVFKPRTWMNECTHARALVCVACVLRIQYEADLAKATMVSSADLKETERKEKEEALKQKARAKAKAQVAEACVLQIAHAPACCMRGVCVTQRKMKCACYVTFAPWWAVLK